MPFEALARVATRSLEANIERWETGGTVQYGVTAGRNQFRSLWTRDFCFASWGLLAAHRSEVVRSHLDTLLSHVRSDGLLPRSLDSLDTKLRVALGTVGRWLPVQPAIQGSLKPEHTDQHGQIAIDGNALAVIAAKRYRDFTGDTQWWEGLESTWDQLLEFYDPHLRDGLIHQPPFSDWQDSVRRDGHTFYSNIAYWAAKRAVGDNPRDLADALRRTFKRNEGLFYALSTGEHVSLEGNLLAIDWGFVEGESAEELWRILKSHPVYSRAANYPGAPTHPDYDPTTRNWGVRAVGLGHYHDALAWAWLCALAARVALVVGDVSEATRLLNHLEAIAQRDDCIAEIYAPEDGWPLRDSVRYRSERPFAWAAGMVLYALAALPSGS